MFRADLHCHSYFSGVASHLRTLRGRDSYSWPLAVYRMAKKRGMDLVTITDHDSIDGCLELLSRHPVSDFMIGEEVTVIMKSETGLRFSSSRQPSIESWSVMVTRSMPRFLAMR